MRIVVRLALFVLLLGAFGSCSVDRRELLRQISANGDLVAILIESSGGGAAGARSKDLYINEQKYPPNLTKPLLSVSHCEHIPFSWRDDHTLEVHYIGSCSIFQFKNDWYKPADPSHYNTYKVEIILVRDY